MPEPAKLTIRHSFTRVDAEKISAFESIPSGWVVDALGRRGALPHWIRPISKSNRFVGSALTVQTRAVDNLAPYAALKYARPGDVLIVACDGNDTASVMGDILIGMAKNAGIVAAVTDGLVRDVAGINAVGIPTFARGLSPNSPFKDGPGSVGLNISPGGVLIKSGDLIVGDVDGVVVVPAEQIDEVIANLSTIRDKEAGMDQAVAAGASYPAWLDDIIEAEARFID